MVAVILSDQQHADLVDMVEREVDSLRNYPDEADRKVELEEILKSLNGAKRIC